MVLKIKIFTLLIVIANSLIAETQINLFYTDKYDSNFFSSTDNKNTSLNIGSNLFSFLKMEDLNICGAFIDSFLRTENIDFNTSIALNNRNSFEVQLHNIDAIACKNLSETWFEKYNIAWITTLKSLIKIEAIEENNAELMILKKLYIDEKSRFFHVSNIINNTQFAFIIPTHLSKNDFKKSQTILNTKRYTSEEAVINFTEVIYNDTTPSSNIQLVFPSATKHSFLKNCISLYFLKNYYTDNTNLDIEYHIAQTIVNYTFSTDSHNIMNFKVDLPLLNLSKDRFNQLKEKAIKDILFSISKDNLYFYSYYDILKLKQMLYLYEAENLNRQIEILNNKTKLIVKVSKSNPYFFQKIKLTDIHKTDFDNNFYYKANSVDFKEDNDTLVFERLNLFMALNKNYDLTIKSFSKQSEYLFIEKEKKEKIIAKYFNDGYNTSITKKLKLYRSLVIFDKLTSNNLDPQRVKCVGLRGKNPLVEFEFSKKD